ncbi:formyltransferase family protein [Helicobacter colisuis]|uniref:formyltransferase family protein n=1 Tax=Helicobacter colisuis TaxID=2949739 RepID=UPI00202A9AA8|nr:formyltransferase family protein [Helicobacter colisuis]MCL9822321.1 methionyl-tRNA formyltransferase [Helicobacter colisuis]
MRVAILTSPNQWFIPYAEELRAKIPKSDLYFSHQEIKQAYEIIFILSYHQIIPKTFLVKNKYNLVIHASNLPKGKGWSPMFWQILEGKNEIIFSLFEADEKADNGEIYLQKILKLNGVELYEELRDKQAKMCQTESFYPKRSPKDSELDLTKSLEEQFNLLRIVSNEEFPAFFCKEGKKFILKIYDFNEK